MSDASSDTFLRLLDSARQGDARAVDQVIPLVYEELHALAARRLHGERPDHTLQPTALVNEVYLRLLKQRNVDWRSRAHFIRIAAEQIRRILVDHARARNRVKRGGDRLRVTLSESVASVEESFDVIALDEALERLGNESEDDLAVVQLRYFGGLTDTEIASVLEVSERTVRRRWTFARAWLYRTLETPEITP